MVNWKTSIEKFAQITKLAIAIASYLHQMYNRFLHFHSSYKCKVLKSKESQFLHCKIS